MEHSESLRKMLTSIARVYNDGEKVEVELADGGNRIDQSGRVYIDGGVDYADVSGANELRLIANSLSHEVEHLRVTDLSSKARFIENHPGAPPIAAAVINILEDQYVDRHRIERFRGLRPTAAWSTELVMQNDDYRPPLTDIPHEMGMKVEGMAQIAFAGYAKDIGNAPDDVREFLAWVRPIIREVRYEDDQDARFDMAETVYTRLIQNEPVEAIEDLIQYLKEHLDDIMDGFEGDMSPDEEALAEEATGSELTVDVDDLLSRYDSDDLVMRD